MADDLVVILESFNRKERFFLISHALGAMKFPLTDSFQEQLEKNNIEVPRDPKNALIAMDYHLDWLHAALILADEGEDGISEFSNEGREGHIIEGTPEDVDLLVAFQANGIFHLILVEAKGYFGWDKGQLSSKANRLRKIFGDDGKMWRGVRPHFYTVGPKKPPTELDCTPPKWMLKEDGKLRWLPMALPERRTVSRCEEGNNGYRKFRIGKVRRRGE